MNLTRNPSIKQAGGWNISGAFHVKSWDLQNSLQIYHNQYNRGGLFSWAVGADERNSTRNIIQLDQGGLGLPSRDYYLNKTDKNVVSCRSILRTRRRPSSRFFTAYELTVSIQIPPLVQSTFKRRSSTPTSYTWSRWPN